MTCDETQVSELFSIAVIYSIAQFKLDRTYVQHELDMARFSFHTCAKCGCARKIDDVKPTVQSSRIHTRPVHDNLQMHTCMFGMHMQIWITRACKL